MTAIGGFLPLETGPAARGGDAWHAGAAALASGRACWHAIVRAVHPRRVLVPFYVCDAVLQPLEATGTACAFYALDETFRPSIETVSDDELMLVVNYFGVMNGFVGDAAARLGLRLVVDDTQAFFRRGGEGWAFNSARKFFGVPDGGYLYGPIGDLGALPPSEAGDCDHLVARLASAAGAWELFRAHEARIGIELRAMSAVSARLLASVDPAEACRRRRDNFVALHETLRSRNTIALSLDRAACDGPLCYPFLPAQPVDRRALAALGVYVPTFWPEIDARADAGFAWERDVARRLLPLPIDHRYDSDDMRALVRAVLQVLL